MTEREYRPARLNDRQLERLRQAERDLGVLLVAYETAPSDAPEGVAASPPRPAPGERSG